MKEQEEINKHMEQIRQRSGNITIDCKLTSFLYTLMRDHVQPGIIEEIMLNHIGEETVSYSNGWLALYAQDVAKRLKPISSPKAERYRRTDEYVQIIKNELIAQNIQLHTDDPLGITLDEKFKFINLMHRALKHCLIHGLDGRQLMAEIAQVQYDKFIFFDIQNEFPEVFNK